MKYILYIYQRSLCALGKLGGFFLRVVIGLHSENFMAFQMFPQALVGRS